MWVKPERAQTIVCKRTVFLVRHFAPHIGAGVCYGQSDIPAVPNTSEQLTQLQAQLPNNPSVFSSPLQRCTSLALQVFPATPIRLAPLLIELNFGAWELTPWHLIARTDLDNWAADPFEFAPPQGESFADVCQRVQLFVQNFLSPDSPAVLFTHAGVIKAFLYLYAGLSINAALRHSAPFASVTQVQLIADSLVSKI